ncbi:hypothetical protein MXD61_26875 [Frankia sp. AgPm24]|nr:hypothetical protein [Frankia sp. AgPm24]MCK9925453.1 hypothetical protein [Frankia sp. AgPm24]
METIATGLNSNLGLPASLSRGRRRWSRDDILPNLVEADRSEGVWVEGLAQAGPALLATSATSYAALARWIDLFVNGCAQ